MVDENRVDFEHRVTRISRAHIAGLGFEAVGTLGRSHYTQRKGLNIPLMGPVLVVIGFVAFLKSLIFVRLGGDLYQARVDDLWAGDALHWLGALIMQPDTLTIWMATQIGRLL